MGAKIPESQITKILPGLTKLVNAGISATDLNIVVKEIIGNKAFQNQFISNPISAAQKVCKFKVE